MIAAICVLAAAAGVWLALRSVPVVPEGAPPIPFQRAEFTYRPEQPPEQNDSYRVLVELRNSDRPWNAEDLRTIERFSKESSYPDIRGVALALLSERIVTHRPMDPAVRAPLERVLLDGLDHADAATRRSAVAAIRESGLSRRPEVLERIWALADDPDVRTAEFVRAQFEREAARAGLAGAESESTQTEAGPG